MLFDPYKKLSVSRPLIYKHIFLLLEEKILEVSWTDFTVRSNVLLSTLNSLVITVKMGQACSCSVGNPGAKVTIGDSVGGTLPFMYLPNAPEGSYGALDTLPMILRRQTKPKC